MTGDIPAGPWMLIASSVIASTVATVPDVMEIIVRGGPVAMLGAALLWMDRLRQAERKRCDAEHVARDAEVTALRIQIDDVRESGERQHHECREELEAVTTRLLRMIRG